MEGWKERTEVERVHLSGKKTIPYFSLKEENP